MEFWGFTGLIINDKALSVRHEADRLATNGIERVLNRAVAGTARVFNYWGYNALRSNCKLFFILKRVPREDMARLSNGRPMQAEAQQYLRAKSSSNKRAGSDAFAVPEAAPNMLYYRLGEKNDFLIVYEQDAEGRQLHASPFQLVPYATDSTEGVPLKARKYIDVDGSVAYGLVYQVGYTIEPQTQGDPSSSPGSILDVKSLSDAGQLNIAVVIETCA